MIPKIIHYCWFGRNPLPPLAVKCIESWRKFLPDYEIKEWNEDNFDVNIIPYTAEAYRLKKYAFVSDYARFWILYKYGGLYFDTDVEVIKNMDDIIAKGSFMGCEHNKGNTSEASVAPGLGLGVNPGLGLYKSIVEYYNTHHFASWRGHRMGNVVTITTSILSQMPHKIDEQGVFIYDDLLVYPPEYFCPKNYYTGELNITEKSVCIHHYSATWVSKNESFLEKVKRRFDFTVARLLTTLHINRTQ